MTIAPIPELESNVSAYDDNKAPDVTTSIFMGGKPALKNWKLFGDIPQDSKVNPEDASSEFDEIIIPRRKFSDRSIRPSRVTPFWLQIGQVVAVFMTVAWIAYATIYILALPNSIKTITSSPLALGGILASVLAPIAMMWLCIATWQRRSDAHIYAEALREELRGLFFPTTNQSDLISEDIRNLMKQATEMSASSRGAIKAIQRARTGLRAEIRDFAGVSQKAEFHIDRLADTMSKRAEELLSLTEVVERQTENISTKADMGLSKWENVSAEVTELGEEIDQIFKNGTEKLQLAANVANSNIGLMDAQAAKLSAVSDTISTGAAHLEESLSGAEKLSSSIESVMGILSDGLNKVEQVAENFFEQTDGFDQKLETRAAALKESTQHLINSAQGLENIGDLAINKLGEALSMSISGADNIANAVRRSKEMMDRSVMDATAQITETSKIADTKLETLMIEAKAQRDALAKLIAELEQQQNLLNQSTKHIDDSSLQISNVAEIAAEKLNAVALKMTSESDKPLHLIQSSIDRLETQTLQMDDKLAVRIVEIQQETGKLKTLSDDVAKTLTENVADLKFASDSVAAQSNRISDDVKGQRMSLNGFVEDMEGKLKYVSNLMSDQNHILEQSIFTTSDKISSLGAMFFDKGDALLEKVQTVSEKVAEYESSLDESLSSLDNKSKHVIDTVQTQIDQFHMLNEKVQPTTDTLMERATSLYSQYQDLSKTCFANTNDITGALASLSETLHERVEKIGAITKDTSELYQSVAGGMSKSLEDISQAAEAAQSRISQLQTGMKDRVDDLHLAGDQIRIKVESMQNNLGVYAKDLSDVLQFAVSDLELATEKFGETTSLLDKKTDGVTTKMIEATRNYVEEGHRMSLMGEQTVHKSARIVSTLQQESDKLLSMSKSSLLELQKSGDVLSIRSKEIEEYMKSSTQMAKTYSGELREQASLIANYSSEMVDQISEATVKLSSRVHDVRQAGGNVIEEIERAEQKLENGAGVMSQLLATAIEAVDGAVSGFTERGKTLQSTVGNLTSQIENIRDVHVRTERDSFLSAAKFIVESLYSLAVDVSRHIEGDLDIRVLRAYQKGDVSAYVKHLIDIMPRMSIDKCQQKFIDDSEFRTYVMRFTRQYEELLQQAQANDYADLLSSVFVTSDIGKLYKILCEIAGRNAREH